MLQIEDFIKRIEFLMEHFSLNASSFAYKISVQRSSISHLLSGRNKPSLDFIMKISDEFPELNLYWLLNGKGHFLKDNKEGNVLEKTETTPSPLLHKNTDDLKKDSTSRNELPSQNTSISKSEDLNSTQSKNNNIHRIVHYYDDGTFIEYKRSELKY